MVLHLQYGNRLQVIKGQFLDIDKLVKMLGHFLDLSVNLSNVVISDIVLSPFLIIYSWLNSGV